MKILALARWAEHEESSMFPGDSIWRYLEPWTMELRWLLFMPRRMFSSKTTRTSGWARKILNSTESAEVPVFCTLGLAFFPAGQGWELSLRNHSSSGLLCGLVGFLWEIWQRLWMEPAKTWVSGTMHHKCLKNCLTPRSIENLFEAPLADSFHVKVQWIWQPSWLRMPKSLLEIWPSDTTTPRDVLTHWACGTMKAVICER